MQRRWPGGTASHPLLVTFLLPVTALLLGVVFLGETVSAQAIGGMVLIGVGLAAGPRSPPEPALDM